MIEPIWRDAVDSEKRALKDIRCPRCTHSSKDMQTCGLSIVGFEWGVWAACDQFELSAEQWSSTLPSKRDAAILEMVLDSAEDAT